MIQVRGLEKIFGDGESRVQALAAVDLTVQANEFVAVMGTSGSWQIDADESTGLSGQTDSGRLFAGWSAGESTE